MSATDRVILRRGTFDRGIWTNIANDYPSTPERFEPADVVVDVGCHIGAFCHLAAERGAGTVLGFEPNRENYALAQVNLAGRPSVTVHNAAIWRSDVEPEPLRFIPGPYAENTGEGSVLFADAPWEPQLEQLSEHEVAAVPLDEALTPYQRIRLLKLDAEGAEFPILLTSRALDRVDAVVGEYHEFTAQQMAELPERAVVGDRTYDWPLLEELLAAAGFSTVRQEVVAGRGLFAAARA